MLKILFLADFSILKVLNILSLCGSYIVEEKQYVAIIDNGGKYEVISKSTTITTVIKDGKIYNIPNIFVIDYNTWVKKNKPKK